MKTSQELFDYITKQMTAEQALLILISDTLETYDSLKKAKPLDENNAVHPLYIVAAAAQDMGWGLILEKLEDSADIRGISIGTEEYFNALLTDTDKLLDDLYEHIKHGDESHQAWLKAEFNIFRDNILTSTRNKPKDEKEIQS